MAVVPPIEIVASVEKQISPMENPFFLFNGR